MMMNLVLSWCTAVGVFATTALIVCLVVALYDWWTDTIANKAQTSMASSRYVDTLASRISSLENKASTLDRQVNDLYKYKADKPAKKGA